MDKANQGAPAARYTDGVSSEPLEIIRLNECEARADLATSRFRRLWNEVETLTGSLRSLLADVEALADAALLDKTTWVRIAAHAALREANNVSAAPAAPSNSKEQP